MVENKDKKYNSDKQWELVNFCEFDKYATKSYCAIHDVYESKNLGDITKVDETELDDFNMICGGSPCFVEGTLVLTELGYKPIEEIKIGDVVLTHNNKWKKVIHTMTNEANELYRIKCMPSEDIHCTANHPFYVRKRNNLQDSKTGKRWREFDKPLWIEAKSLTREYYVGTAINNKSEIPHWEGIITAISFSVAPIVNASNRIGKNDIAMKAFIEDDNKTLLKYMRELKKCKELQNEEVDNILPGAIQSCEEQKNKKMMVVFIETDYGISGLLGNKLLEKYKRPILVLKDCSDTYRGSMRAIGVEDFRKICNESGLAKAEGHELASGFEIKKELLEEFELYIEKNLPELRDNSVTSVDIQLDISDITRKMVDLIKRFDRISGTNFQPVKVYIDNIYDYEIGNMSDYKHLTIKPNDYLLIIKWNFNGSFDEMEDHSLFNDELKVVGTIDSGFLGRKFVLKVVCDEIEEVG